MQIQFEHGAFSVNDDVVGVGFGPSRPVVRFTSNGREITWVTSLVPAGAGWSSTHSASGLGIELTAETPGTHDVAFRARLRNHGDTPVTLHRLTMIATERLCVGDDPTSWRMYRNSYQSWAGTWTIGVDERDRDVPTRFGRLGVTDGRHPAPHGRGHVRSDAIGAVAGSGAALAAGFTTLADAFGFVEVTAPGGDVRSFDVWLDLDDVLLAPGASTEWFGLRLAARTDGTAALRAVVDAAGDEMGALGRGVPHPAGWCSWYYYFTKVSEADILANLEVLARDGRDGPLFGAEYVMVDDGHQTAIGDWLSTNEKFPSGMAAVASRIVAAGFDAGIWWAPFIVSSKSRVAAEHPDWLVRNRRGTPILGLVNPGWGLAPMWVLDTTHPEVLAHLREVARVIGHEWGFRIQKIDFLFAAAHEGVRHDSTATRAQALRRGIQAVRDGSPDGFVLGCGSPMGPAVGLVDAMRIGADVTPSWTTAVAATAGRGRHALSTANALLNTMTRSVLDGAWFLNDPDCLMVRDTDTKMTETEVHTMCTVFGMTDGMIVLSDRMDTLPPDRQGLVARTRALAGGRATIADLFDRALPSVIVSRHAERVDIGVVNLTDQPMSGRISFRQLGISDEVTQPSSSAERPVEYWSGRPVDTTADGLDLGTIAPHASRVVQLARRPRLSAG